MPAVTVTDTWNDWLTATVRAIRTADGWADNIFNDLPTMKWLQMRGSVREDTSGGLEIVLPVNFGKNTTAAAYEGYDEVDTSPQDTGTVARYPWKFYTASISFSDKERLTNRGEFQRLNLLQHKTDIALMSIKDKFIADFYTDVASDPAKAVTPITLLIDDGPTSTVGNINGNTETWWQNYQADVGAFGTNLWNDMLIAYNTVSRGASDFPDTIIFSQTGFERFERFLTGDFTLANNAHGFRVNMNANAEAAVGFPTIRFKAADVFWDPALASGVPVTGETAYFINTKWFFYYVQPEADFAIGEFQRPTNQHASVALVNHMCNTCTNNRRKLGIIHGIDA